MSFATTLRSYFSLAFRWQRGRQGTGYDKMLLLTMFVMLTLPGLNLANHLPLWLTVLVISRDVAIVLTVAIFALLGLIQKLVENL